MAVGRTANLSIQRRTLCCWTTTVHKGPFHEKEKFKNKWIFAIACFMCMCVY